MNATKKPFEIKPSTIQQLADAYSVGYRAMRQWINNMKEEVGEKRGRYYTIKQVEIIITKLGVPGQTIAVD